MNILVHVNTFINCIILLYSASITVNTKRLTSVIINNAYAVYLKCKPYQTGTHNDMEPRFSGKAESYVGCQIAILGWDQKVHFYVHRSTCLIELNREEHTTHPEGSL